MYVFSNLQYHIRIRWEHGKVVYEYELAERSESAILSTNTTGEVMTEHLHTSFADYKKDNRMWITLAKGLYYPDYL